MRKISTATVAIILAIALYFTLFWGYDGLRVLTSPNYGLDDVWRSQFMAERCGNQGCGNKPQDKGHAPAIVAAADIQQAAKDAADTGDAANE